MRVTILLTTQIINMSHNEFIDTYYTDAIWKYFNVLCAINKG